MRRDTTANSRWPRLVLALALLSGASGCAWFGAQDAPNPALTQAGVEALIDADIDAMIARSLPEVSYESQNPAMNDPLGPSDPSVLLRNVETLDGTGRIVCRKQGPDVFGTCIFPPVAAP